jgi:predicted small lipoprotein YifL
VILIVKSSFALPTALATVLALSACGQTGPLTMPKPPQRQGAAAPAAPATPATPPSITVPPAPGAGTAVPVAGSNADNTQATTPPSSVPASQ